MALPKKIEMGVFHEKCAKRYIRTNHVITVVEYGGISIRTDPVQKSKPGEGEENRSRENYLRRQYLRKCAVMNLARMNFDNRYDKFLTLTQLPEGAGLDVSLSNDRFKSFIRKMRRKYGKFKYLAVIEFTEKGAVHYHMMNDLPYIEQSQLQREWGNIVFINAIRHVDDLGAYLSKYMTKDNDDSRLRGEKGYLCSHDLLREHEVRSWEGKTGCEHAAALQEIQEIEDLIKGKEPVRTSSTENRYCGTITYRQYNLKRG